VRAQRRTSSGYGKASGVDKNSTRHKEEGDGANISFTAKANRSKSKDGH